MAAKKSIPDFEKEGFEELGDEDRYPVHEWRTNDVLWGLLIGKREVETKKGLSMLYSVELTDDCKDYLGTEEDRLSFWGSQILDTRLKNVKPEQEEVVVEYLGMKKGKKNDYHNFRVMHKPIEGSGDKFDIPDEEENE